MARSGDDAARRGGVAVHPTHSVKQTAPHQHHNAPHASIRTTSCGSYCSNCECLLVQPPAVPACSSRTPISCTFRLQVSKKACMLPVSRPSAPTAAAMAPPPAAASVAPGDSAMQQQMHPPSNIPQSATDIPDAAVEAESPQALLNNIQVLVVSGKELMAAQSLQDVCQDVVLLPETSALLIRLRVPVSGLHSGVAHICLCQHSPPSQMPLAVDLLQAAQLLVVGSQPAAEDAATLLQAMAKEVAAQHARGGGRQHPQRRSAASQGLGLTSGVGIAAASGNSSSSSSHTTCPPLQLAQELTSTRHQPRRTPATCCSADSAGAANGSRSKQVAKRADGRQSPVLTARAWDKQAVSLQHVGITGDSTAADSAPTGGGCVPSKLRRGSATVATAGANSAYSLWLAAQQQQVEFEQEAWHEHMQPLLLDVGYMLRQLHIQSDGRGPVLLLSSRQPPASCYAMPGPRNAAISRSETLQCVLQFTAGQGLWSLHGWLLSCSVGAGTLNSQLLTQQIGLVHSLGVAEAAAAAPAPQQMPTEQRGPPLPTRPGYALLLESLPPYLQALTDGGCEVCEFCAGV